MHVWEEVPWLVGLFPLWLLVVSFHCDPQSPQWVETLGGISQLFGVVFIIGAVDHELSQHGESLIRKSWRWIQRTLRRLLGRTETVQGLAADVTIAGTSAVDGSAKVSLPRAMSEIEKRLEHLESEAQNLRRQVVGHGKQLKRLKDRVSEATQTFQEQLHELKEDAAASATGRARWDLTGAALFFQGIVFTTWSAGVARLLG